MSKSDSKPSLRQQIKIYKSNLSGAQLAEFNRVYNEQSETKEIKKAFVAAKEAALKIAKLEQEERS